MQSTIALNSGESEFYALIKGAATGLGFLALLEDWGIKVPLKLHTDSSACLSFVSRRGLGTQRHVQTRYLWVQQYVADGAFKVVKVLGAENHSDILTKPMPFPSMEKHCKRLGLEFHEGAAAKQKAVIQ
jgi:hypothetical protein